MIGKTYCNPLPVEGVPSGRFLDMRITNDDPRKYNDYRSISDPSVIYHDGRWYLYPSYSLAYVSEDFVSWKKIDIGLEDISYSPAVACHRGKWYMLGHEKPDMYVSDSPAGPFVFYDYLRDRNGNPFRAVDCCLFEDDDGRLYIYWHGMTGKGDIDCEYMTATYGCELDPDSPSHMLGTPKLINHFEPSFVWQRIGENNENERMGWIEGQWMYKRGGRYYLLYSGSGTQYSSYATGIMYSDNGPLGDFVPQKYHDPLTQKFTGLVRGAGHGSIAEGPDGTLWVFYTCIFCFNHLYERRICMDPLGIDEHGELYCPACTENPQFAPGVTEHPELGNDAGLLPLNFMKRPTATSCAPGREPIYSVDQSVLTWWQPSDDDEEPCATFTLGEATAYDISALRIIWRDIGMETLDGIFPGAFGYFVEYQANQGDEWHMLIDERDNRRDLCIDYRTFDTVRAMKVRITITHSPEGIKPGLCSFIVFGRCAH